MDGNGDVIWSKTYGGTNLDVLTDVFVSGSHIFVDGSTRSAGAGNWDAWILKLNLNDGSVEFSKTYGGSADEEVRSLMPKGSGVMVLAYTKSWGAGGTDFWAFEIDGNGNLLYSATYGGNGDDIPYMGINTSDGGYIFVGTSQTPSFSSGRAYDYFVVKISPGGYSCIRSFTPTPTITNFNPTINTTSETPLSSTPGNSDPNFTQSSPDLDYTVVCAPLGGDDELSVYGNRLVVKAEGREIKIFSVDGKLWKG